MLDLWLNILKVFEIVFCSFVVDELEDLGVSFLGLLFGFGEFVFVILFFFFVVRILGFVFVILSVVGL